jgi:hypothetical protein
MFTVQSAGLSADQINLIWTKQKFSARVKFVLHPSQTSKGRIFSDPIKLFFRSHLYQGGPGTAFTTLNGLRNLRTRVRIHNSSFSLQLSQ